MRVRCVLSDGTRGTMASGYVPSPASLFVVADLGHAFRGMGLDEQRRAIEGALTDALAVALAKLDALHDSNPANTRADRPDLPCLPARADALAPTDAPSSNIAVA